MRKKASTNLISSKTIIGILVILAVFAGIYLLIKSDIPLRFKNIFPDYFPKNDTLQVEFSLICPIKSVIIVQSDEKYLEICRNPDCSSHYPSGFYLEDNLIKKTGSGALSDTTVGQINRGNIVIFSEIISGVGSEQYPDLYFELEENLPPLEDLLKIHLSYFYSDKELCRDSIITEEEWRKNLARREIKVPFEFISSGILYYNVDELIKNKGKTKTNLYRDTNLKILANSWIGEEGDENYVDEENKGQFSGKTSPRSIENFIGTSNQDILYFPACGNLAEGVTCGNPPFDITTPQGGLDNKYNKLGTYTNGDNLIKISFRKMEGNIYVKFTDADWISPQGTNWIRLDYWNAYRNAARLPNWAKI